MSVATLFILGVLFIWLAVTGRAGRMITALTGGSDESGAQPTSGAITDPGQQLPGTPDPTLGMQPTGMAQSFTGPLANPYAWPYLPPVTQ